MNKVVLIFLLLKLSSYFMLDMFDVEEPYKRIKVNNSLLEEVIESQTDSADYYAEVLGVER